jgi:hypothetical protein
MKKARMNKLKVKAMMIVFFDNRGSIMIEREREGQTVNQKYYLEVLIKLGERVWKKTLEMWKKFLAGKCIPVFKKPPIHWI